MTTSSSTDKIGVIGAGNMGMAIYRCLKEAFPSFEILVCRKDKSKSLSTTKKVLQECPTVILAFKPADLEKFSEEAGKSIEDKLLISVLGGVSLKQLCEATGADRVIRTMPNLPIQVGKGIIAWIASKDVKKREKTFAKQIFSSMGTELELSDEKRIDSVTAISGCGPAYFFYLCEILAAKAEALGFTPEEAKKLAENSCIGSAALLDADIQSAEKWRHAVTSKGGITEAALNYLQEHSFADIFTQAIEEAKKKSHAIECKNSKR